MSPEEIKDLWKKMKKEGMRKGKENKDDIKNHGENVMKDYD